MTDLTETEKQANGSGCHQDWIDWNRIRGLRSGEYKLTDYDRERGFEERMRDEVDRRKIG